MHVLKNEKLASMFLLYPLKIGLKVKSPDLSVKSPELASFQKEFFNNILVFFWELSVSQYVFNVGNCVSGRFFLK